MSIARRALDIEAGGFRLSASLWAPPSAIGVVIAAQPCGLERLVMQGGAVLEGLCAEGYAVFALGLLNPAEEQSDELARARRFDIEELSNRLGNAIDWLVAEGVTSAIGVLASGTAAAAALTVASGRRVGAIVSIDGRPDLAAKSLLGVASPTLFLVGADNVPGHSFSQLAADRMRCTREVQVVAAAGSLEALSEPAAAELAVHWFERHLGVVQVTNESPDSRADEDQPKGSAATPLLQQTDA